MTEPSKQTKKERALAGVKVADFSWAIAGPFATKHLADYGATVVRVETPDRPCVIRTSQPFKDGKPGVNRSGYFAYFNVNKYSLALDLNHQGAIEIARRLVAWSDVVVENFTGGTMEKWGLGYEDLKRIKPDIIMLRSTNQGQTGPFAGHPGLGNHLNALTGLVHLTGWPDEEPVAVMVAYTDYFAPQFAATAVIAALDHRRRTGKGQLLDISQLEVGLQVQMPVILDYTVNGRVTDRMGNARHDAAPHGVYRCKGEDRWCAIAAFTDQDWLAFCKVLGSPAWTADAKFSTLASRKQNEDELNRLIETWTADYPAEQVMHLMQGAGVSAGVVQNSEDLHSDPQMKHREFLWQLEHQELGVFSHQGQASILSKTPAVPRMPAPCLGEHTEHVCKEFLCMSGEEFDELMVAGVFGF